MSELDLELIVREIDLEIDTNIYRGADGATFIPTVSTAGVISWTNDKGYENPDPVNIKGPAGADGHNGATFTPSVSTAGIISWTNDGGLPNPDSVDITGPQGPAGQGVPSGGTTGQVLKKTSGTDYATAWADEYGLTILSYGASTWAEFLAAYNKNAIVYCRASSNVDPSIGTQGRLAFMAYVNLSGSTPTSVEFQYYRSVTNHSDAQQGDQVFVYKLDSAGAWTVTTREAYTKIAAGTGLSSSYSSGTLTINNSAGLPSVSSPTDDGKVLRVVSGVWTAVQLPSASGVSF